MNIRRSELILVSFFLYAALMGLVRPVPVQTKALLLGVNTAVIAVCLAFALVKDWDRHQVLGHVRDWFPAAMILLAYREMGWLALPHANQNFENYWIVWDRRILYDWGFKAALESLGPVLPNLLELAYLLVYGVPVYMVAIFYSYGKRERLDDAYSILLFGALATYGMYPFFPSDPPRSVFAGMDLPLMSAVRALNLRIVGNYGIHTSVFPSGHSAAAFGAAFAVLRLLPESRWRGRNMLMLAVLIALGSFYGRYHYAVDALAGFGVALAGYALSRGWVGQSSSGETPELKP